MQYLKFEYGDTEDSWSTKVEKTWEPRDRQFDELMLEIRTCLLACGYSEVLVNDYIPNNQEIIMKPQTQLEFADLMFDALMAYNTDPAKTEDACINDVRNLVDMIWERAQEDCDMKTPYNDGYQEGYKEGQGDADSDSYDEGYEAAKKEFGPKSEDELTTDQKSVKKSKK